MSEDLKLTYEERAEKAINPAAKKLFKLMAEKKTNIALADDVTNADMFLDLADNVGPDIAVLKTHIDVLENFTPEVIDELLELSKKHNFMIFEDRKFADIGNTVVLQYSKGLYRIAEWANFVNIHIVPGPGIIEGISSVMNKINDGKERGIIILAQMTSEGTIATGEYTKKAVEIANRFKEDVAGFIGAGSVPEQLKQLTSISFTGQLILTPGVKLAVGSDKLGQRYATPEDAISAGSDCIIVGRGIYKAEDPIEAARKFRQAAWEAYLKRVE